LPVSQSRSRDGEAADAAILTVLLAVFLEGHKIMKTITFVVKVNRGNRAPEYVQRVDATPLHMTTNPKLALLMGKLTAEDAIESLGNSRCIPELLSVPVA
jgi:hypothetical protein